MTDSSVTVEKPASSSHRATDSLRTLVRSGSATAIGLISAMILGRGLGVSGYGAYQLLVNLATQIGQICEASVGTAFIALNRDGRLSEAQIDRSLVRFACQATIVAIPMVCLLTVILVDHATFVWLAAACIIAVATIGQLLLLGSLRSHRQISQANFQMLCPPAISTALCSFLWLAEALTPINAVWTLAGSLVVSLAIGLSPAFLRRFLRRASRPIDLQTGVVSARQLLSVGWRASVAKLAQLLIYRFDLFLIAAMMGSESIGLYVPAVFLASQLNQLGDAVGFVLLPDIARGRADVSQACKACRLVLVPSIIAGATLAVLSPWLFAAVWGRDFSGAALPFLLLLPGYVVLTPVRAVSAYLNVATEFRATMKASLGGVVTNIVLNIALIPKFGTAGAATATTAALLVVCGLLTTGLHRESGEGWKSCWLPRLEDIRQALRVIRR
ncbi:MAG: lipopolysaccharide biosynthesis protein [Planctomycetota bacterium]